MTNPTRSRVNEHVRLPIPSVINPPGRRCITIEIPDHYEHFAAFWGHFLGMTKWYTWKLDSAKSGKELAEVYKGVWAASRERFVKGEVSCMTCTDVNVPFEVEIDGCATYAIHVIAGHFAVLPTYVRPGDVITLIGAHGVWRDGMTIVNNQSNWYRFDGGDYTNITDPAPTSASDIVPTFPHMALTARFDDNGTPYYWQLGAEFGGANEITIPATVDPAGVIFELFANGPLLNDSAYDLEFFQPHGEMCVTIQVCHEIPCPQVLIDFEPTSEVDYDVILGSVVSTSPIGEGYALLNGSVQTISAQAIIEVPLTGCALYRVAFTVYEVKSATSGVLQLACVMYDAEGNVIDNTGEEFSPADETVQSFTHDFTTSPDVFKLRLAWTVVSAPNDLAEFWIDNVYIN